MSDTLSVNEIFLSIQGEGTRAGLPCVLVRLAGCNLRCSWCDTRYAWNEGSPMTVDRIVRDVLAFACPRAELTGGEPLLQAASAQLLGRLCDAGLETLLETNGSLDISAADARVVRIVDVKCPSSGEVSSFRMENLRQLRPADEVKFVLADRGDYEFARDFTRSQNLIGRCPVIFSPVGAGLASATREGGLPADTLAAWLLADKLDVRLGLQLHKIIWPQAQRGV